MPHFTQKPFSNSWSIIVSRIGFANCIEGDKIPQVAEELLMAENSKIEWTDHTFNPWVGCTKISVGPLGACEQCYAESWAKRTGNPDLWNGLRRRTTAVNWRQPLKWNAEAATNGTRPRVFCASLADVFDNAVPDEWRADLWKLIRQTPHLQWLLLTKRIGNAYTMLPEDWGIDGWRHVAIGATIASQPEMARDVEKLRRLPAWGRFISFEPLLGPIEFGRYGALHGIHWAIVGGESGPRARPMELAWVVRLHEQCKARGIAFFMKQGSQANWPRFKS